MNLMININKISLILKMKRNLIILVLIFFIVVGAVTVLLPNFIISYETGKIAQAAGSSAPKVGLTAASVVSKLFFGGKITKFNICVIDPQPSATTCNISCRICSPMVNKMMGPSACVAYNEMIYESETVSKTGQNEKKVEVLCPPKSIVYLGMPPVPRGNFLGFGLSKIMPLLIYITLPTIK